MFRPRFSLLSCPARPWLLLWLLPYVFFTVAADGWHNHALLGNSFPTAAGAPTKETCCSALPDPANAAAHADCSACQWQATSAGRQFVVSFLPQCVAQSVAFTTAPTTYHAPACRTLHSRGPPLV